MLLRWFLSIYELYQSNMDTTQILNSQFSILNSQFSGALLLTRRSVDATPSGARVRGVEEPNSASLRLLDFATNDEAGLPVIDNAGEIFS